MSINYPSSLDTLTNPAVASKTTYYKNMVSIRAGSTSLSQGTSGKGIKAVCAYL